MEPQEISVNISELAVIYRAKKTNKERREIRDFLVTLTGFSKDYAAKLLRGNRVRTGKKTGRGPTYSEEVRNMLIELWERAGCPNTKALQARIDRFVEELGEVRHLRPEVADRLRRMSASTMDRILRGRPRKKPGFTVRRKTPRAPSAAQTLATEVSGEAIPAYLCKPGEVQVDTVALYGGDMSGNFHWILTVTDRVTLWTEIRCVWNKGAAGVFAALEDALASFPYKVRILHFDNGNEFMNAHLLAFVRRHPEYAYQRSRPRQKNDNAHVKQRNYKKRTNHLTKRERPVDFPGQHGRLCARPCPDVLFYCHATGEPWNTLRFALTSCLRRNLGNFAVTKQRVKRRRAVLARPSFACLVTGIRGPGRKPQRRTRFYGPEHRTESGEQTEER